MDVSSGFHRIPGAANRADDVLHVREIERLAQASNMDIHGAFVDVDVMPPDAIKKLRTGKDAAGRRHQEFEKAELGRTKAHFPALAMNAVGLTVEFDIAAFENAGENFRP